jgi:mannobiose 2-epimerase
MSLEMFAEQVEKEVLEYILPFHTQFCVDQEQGGFYGHVDDDRTAHPNAPKGLVQHSRILWAFAHAYRHFADPPYLETASRAYWYLLRNFWDAYHQGMIWLVDGQGQPVDSHKIIYGQAFAIYGLSEYFLATGEEQSLDTAVSLFRTLERHATDPHYGGYFDAFLKDWHFTDAINVDETAEPTVKSMNTHLHMLEAYTNLLRAWESPQLRDRLRALIQIMIEHIIDQERGQMKMHFTVDWQSLTNFVSYGHDIEASWLLVEATELLGEEELLAKVSSVALHMAQVAYDEGLDVDGSLRDHDNNDDRIWWVQTEAMVGFFNAYQLSGKPHFLQASLDCWRYVQELLIDRQYGEWIWGLNGDGSPISREKAGLWKSPYHNGRACLEIMRRIEQIHEPTQSPSELNR